MMNAGWNIVLFSFFMHAAAQTSKECATPSVHQFTRLDPKYLTRLKYSHGEKVYYDCEEGFTPLKGSRSVQCNNGKWTLLTLKCEKKSCGNAGDLPNGEFRYEGGSFIGDKVYATCNHGYTLKGSKYLICKSSGWTGEFPSCEEIGARVATCSSPVVANSVNSGGDAAVQGVGDSVTFTCNQGFQLDGSQQVTCGPDGQWQPRPPQCLPSNDIGCVKPKLQQRSLVVSGLKQSYKHGDTLSFSCKQPFMLNGSATAACGLNGKWTPSLPKCILTKCPELKVAHSRLSSRHVRVDRTITVSCEKGYQQKGPRTVVCLKTGKWSAIPQCVSENGAETTCSSPAVANSVKSGGDAAVHGVGDSVTFTCNQGFQLEGSKQVTCGPDGQWQPQLPQCLPSSDKGGCAVPADTYEANAHLADGYIMVTSFASGDQVSYVCDIGYTPAGGSRYRICVNGKWTPMLLTCELKSCGSAGEVENGQFVYNGAEFGDTVTAVCNEGYLLVGQGTRTCRNEGWDGRVPVCEVIECDEPQQATNAVRIGSPAQSYMFRSVIGYRCPSGTLTGQREIWCTKDGTWSAPPPVCKVTTCDTPNVPNAMWMWKSTPYQYRDVVSFECVRGHIMHGTSTVVCGANGQWLPHLPACRARGRYRGY